MRKQKCTKVTISGQFKRDWREGVEEGRWEKVSLMETLGSEERDNV